MGDLKRIGVLGPPVIVGAGGIGRVDRDPAAGVELRALPASSKVRTRHSSRSNSGSGAGRRSGSRRCRVVADAPVSFTGRSSPTSPSSVTLRQLELVAVGARGRVDSRRPAELRLRGDERRRGRAATAGRRRSWAGRRVVLERRRDGRAGVAGDVGDADRRRERRRVRGRRGPCVGARGSAHAPVARPEASSQLGEWTVSERREPAGRVGRAGDSATLDAGRGSVDASKLHAVDSARAGSGGERRQRAGAVRESRSASPCRPAGTRRRRRSCGPLVSPATASRPRSP